MLPGLRGPVRQRPLLRQEDRDDIAFVEATPDPYGVHEAHLRTLLWEFGISEREGYVVDELMTGREIPASGSWFWGRPDPQSNPAEISRLERGGVG
jgi:hypothetical protein